MNRIVAKCLIEKQGRLKIVPLEIKCLDFKISEINEEHNRNVTCDGVIIPSLFNMHSHLGESVFRNIDGNDWSISKYLAYTERYNAGLSEKQKTTSWIESARYSAEEMQAHGTVGFCAARSAEIAVAYNMLTMSGYPIMNSHKLIDYKKAGVEGFQSYWDENKVNANRIGIFLHSVYANGNDSFELARKCMDAGAEFITVHISEDIETTELEKQAHGMSAVAVLNKYGLLSDKTILVHCGYCSDEDLSIVKKSGSIISVCPISNIFLNTKMIDLYKLEDLDIPWCIATDGLGTGRTFSLFRQVDAAREQYPNISLDKYWNSITRVPGMIFHNDLYTGDIEVGTNSTLLRTEYDGDDVNELLKGLVEGKIGFSPIKV